MYIDEVLSQNRPEIYRINYFADPYDNELWASVIVRNRRHNSALPESEFVRSYLLSDTLKLKLSLAGAAYLENMLLLLPDTYTFESVFQNNTLLPYIMPFLSERNRSEVMNCRSSENVNRIIGKGKNATVHPRYCPYCMARQKEITGEIHLKRYHHIRGVDHCIICGTRLKEFPMSCGNLHDCLSAGPDMFSAPDEQDGEKESDPNELAVGRLAYELLETDFSRYSLPDVKKSLRLCLVKCGYIKDGHINQKKLNEDLKERFGEDFLRRKGLAGPDGNVRSFITRDIISDNAERTAPVYCYLILISFFCENISEFFEDPGLYGAEAEIEDRIPPGERTFGEDCVCTNPFCAEYGKADTVRIYKRYNRDRYYVKCCKCGMIRIAPAGRVIQHGDVFMAGILNMSAQGASIREISETIGFGRTRTRELLKEARSGKSFTPVDDQIGSLKKELIDKRNELAERDGFTETGPLVLENYAAFNCLCTYEPEWVHDYMDGLKTVSRDHKIKTRDRETLARLKETYNGLLRIDPPVRITRNRILGASRTVSEKGLGCLPESSSYLESVCEDHLSYNKRLIRSEMEKLAENSGSSTWSLDDLSWNMRQRIEYNGMMFYVLECARELGLRKLA